MRKPQNECQRISLYEFMSRFETEQDAMQYIESRRWPAGRVCPDCGSEQTRRASHQTMPYWCGLCRRYFSVKTATLMEGSRISYRKWLMAIYLLSTSPKGVASTRLGSELGIQQKSAWYLSHRIRTAWAEHVARLFGSEVEGDETYLGGKEKNKHKHKKLKAGRGTVGKVAVVGLRERSSGQVKSYQVADTKADTLQRIVCENVAVGSTVYTDDAGAYDGLHRHGYRHETVRHSAGEYVKGRAHINGAESFWSGLKRGYCGVYHKMSPKHLQKYVDEFSARHNVRQLDTMVQIDGTVQGLVSTRRLKYVDLVGGADGRLHRDASSASETQEATLKF